MLLRSLMVVAVAAVVAAPPALADSMRFDIGVSGRQVRVIEATKVGKGPCGLGVRAVARDVTVYSLSSAAAKLTARGGAVRAPNGYQLRLRNDRVVRTRFFRASRCRGPMPKPRLLRCPRALHTSRANWEMQIYANNLILPMRDRRRDPLAMRATVADPTRQRYLCHRISATDLTRLPRIPGGWEDRGQVIPAEGDATGLIAAIRRHGARPVVVRGDGVERRGRSSVSHRFTARFRPVPRSFRLRMDGPAIPNPYTGGTYRTLWEGRACGISPFDADWQGTWRGYSERPGTTAVDHGTWSARFPVPDAPVRPRRFVSFSGFVDEEPAEVEPGGLPWEFEGHPERREMRIVELPAPSGRDEPLWLARAREPVYSNAGDYIGEIVQEAEVSEVEESCTAPAP